MTWVSGSSRNAAISGSAPAVSSTTTNTIGTSPRPPGPRRCSSTFARSCKYAATSRYVGLTTHSRRGEPPIAGIRWSLVTVPSNASPRVERARLQHRHGPYPGHTEVGAAWAVASRYAADTFTHDGKERRVYRRGQGPAVIVISEAPGITPDVVGFADRVAELGCTAVMPHLFGQPGKEDSVPYDISTIAWACVSREFA